LFVPFFIDNKKINKHGKEFGVFESF